MTTIEKEKTTVEDMGTFTIDRDMGVGVSVGSGVGDSLDTSLSGSSDEEQITSDKDTVTDKDLTSDGSIVMGEDVMIEANLWHQRLQDKGCSKENLPKLTYKKSRIMALGTHEIPVYYYNLTSIAIDMASKMEIEKNMGRGWASYLYIYTSCIFRLYFYSMFQLD